MKVCRFAGTTLHAVPLPQWHARAPQAMSNEMNFVGSSAPKRVSRCKHFRTTLNGCQLCPHCSAHTALVLHLGIGFLSLILASAFFLVLPFGSAVHFCICLSLSLAFTFLLL